MDKVLRKRYRGKLEHRETDLIDRLPPPRRLDQIALTAALPVPPVVREGSSSDGVNPLAIHRISTVVPLGRSRPIYAEEDEDNKDGVISDVRHMHAKRKAILALGETVTGAPNVAKLV